MDFEALFRNKVFQQLEPAQLQLFRQFANDIKGKGSTEIAKLYMQLNQKVNQIKPITITQKNAIIDAIRNFLPEADRQKFFGFIKILGR